MKDFGATISRHAGRLRLIAVALVVAGLVFGVVHGVHYIIRTRSATQLSGQLRTEIQNVVLRDLHNVLRVQLLSVTPPAHVHRLLRATDSGTNVDAETIRSDLHDLVQTSPYVSEVRAYNATTLRGYSNYRSGPLSLASATLSNADLDQLLDVIFAQTAADHRSGLQQWSWLSRSIKRNLGFRERSLVFVHTAPMFLDPGQRPDGIVMVALEPWKLMYDASDLQGIHPEDALIAPREDQGAMLLADATSLPSNQSIYVHENTLSRRRPGEVMGWAETPTRELRTIVRLSVPFLPATTSGTIVLFTVLFLGFRMDGESRIYTLLTQILARRENSPVSVSHDTTGIESSPEASDSGHSVECQELVQEVKAYITASDKAALSLETVADAFHISSRHLSRLFSTAEGESFSKYLVRARFEAACVMLCEEMDLSVAEVSNRIGYANVGYFIKLFKQHTGLTPGQYRKRSVLGSVHQSQDSA